MALLTKSYWSLNMFNNSPKNYYISLRLYLVRKTGMEWNQDLNPGGLGMELESWAQLFGENWNGIRSHSLLFGEQFWNGINSVFILKILYASMNIYNNNNIYYNNNNNYYNNNNYNNTNNYYIIILILIVIVIIIIITIIIIIILLLLLLS